MFKSLFSKLIFKKVKTKKCNFCDCNEHAENPFIAGDNVSICSNCVLSAYKILFGEVKPVFAKEGWNDEYYECDDIDFFDAIRKKEIKNSHADYTRMKSKV